MDRQEIEDIIDGISFEYEAFGPSDNEDEAESGLSIEADFGRVSASEWTSLHGYIEDPDMEDMWSKVSIDIEIFELLDTGAPWRKTYSRDKGWSVETIAKMTPAKQKDALISVAIAAMGYGAGSEETVNDLWD